MKKSMSGRSWMIVIFLMLFFSELPAKVILVDSKAAIESALASALPGEEIVIRDNIYEDVQLFLINRSGTEKAPVIVRAENPGKAIFKGTSKLKLSNASFIIINGLRFRDGDCASNVWYINASDSRITDCSIENYNQASAYGSWVVVRNQRNRIDHCYFRGIKGAGATIQLGADGAWEGRHQFDHNYVSQRQYGNGASGWQTILIGTTSYQKVYSHITVEHNLLEDCNGDAEFVSNKASENIIRYNTFRRCYGELVLRHGSGCIVEGNYIFGEGVAGTGGIRINGDNHKVINNYISNVKGWGIRLQSGELNPLPSGNEGAHDVLIAFNTLVDITRDAIRLARGYSVSKPEIPDNIVIVNNLLFSRGGRRLISSVLITQEDVDRNFYIAGNLGFGAPAGTVLPDTALLLQDPELVQDMSDNVWLPTGQSPGTGKAVSNYFDFEYEVKHDIRGMVRPAVRDIGAYQMSGSGTVVNIPLKSTDTGCKVGPSWMGSCDSALPVRLISFEGRRINSIVNLKWSAIETGLGYYILERSMDGSDFEFVAKIEGGGVYGSQQNYSYDDLSAYPGLSYYRLRVVERDGTTSYSNIVIVDPIELKTEMGIYPNPVNTILTISGIYEEVKGVEIVDDISRVIIPDAVTILQAGTVRIDMSTVPAGPYYIKIVTDKNSYLRKVIKMN